MRIAWFTAQVLRGTFTPSVYLTQMIVPRLRALGVEVTLFSDTVNEHHEHFLNAGSLHEKNPYDVFFHQVEEGKRSHFLRTAVGLYPGVVFFHDLYLSDLGPDPLTNSPWSLIAGHLEKEKDEAIAWPNRLTEFPRKGPFPEREFGLAWGALFANPRLRQDGRHAPKQTPHSTEKMTGFIPYPVAQKIEHPIGQIDLSANKVAICGSPFIEDRIHKIFLGLRGLKKIPPIEWMVAPEHREIALKRVQEFGFHSIKIVADCSVESWAEIVSSASAAIHLHYSVFGSLSPFVEISMASEVPILISGLIDDRYYPEDTAFTVLPGESEGRSVALLLENILDARMRNQDGRRFVEANNSPDQIAIEFISVFKNFIVASRCYQERWNRIVLQARNSLLNEIASLDDDHGSSNGFKKVFDELGWS